MLIPSFNYINYYIFCKIIFNFRNFLLYNYYNYKYIRKKKVVYVHIESIYESLEDLSWRDSWLNHYYDVDEEK